jgi:protein associated with RNAse G/E
MQQTHHSKQEQKLLKKHRENEYEEQQRTYEYDPQQEQLMYELYQILQQQNKSEGGFIRRKQTRRKQTRRMQTRRLRRKNKTHKR